MTDQELSESGDGEAAPTAGDETLQIVESVTSPESEIDLTGDKSLPDMLVKQAESHGEDVAVRWKRYGVWEEYTWSDYLDKVEKFALGLKELGVDEDDVLFTIGYNRPHQVWAWMAILGIGGIAAPAYKDKLPEELLTQLQRLESPVVFADDQEMVDKILQISDDVDRLETIIYRDEKGMFRYADREDPEVLSYDAVEKLGEEALEGGSADGGFREMKRTVSPDDIAFLPPTGGTTGASKRPKLSHRNYINVAEAQLAVDPELSEIDYFSVTTMGWSGEQLFLTAATFLENWTVHFAEDPSTEDADLREIGPEVLISSPALFEDWVADVQARIENTTRFKRWAYESAMSIGERYLEAKAEDGTPPLWLRSLHKLSYWTVYRPILDDLGLTRVKKAYTGGAPFGEEHFRFYQKLTFPIKQMFGQTEIGSFVTVQRDDDIRLETVGQPLPNYEVGVTKEGELAVSGPVLTEGYFNQPEKTAELMQDGWLLTGDEGTVTDDGHVTMTERLGDVYEVADGELVPPSDVESSLKFNPYIKEAMVVGDGEAYLGALVNIRYDNVAEWADQHDIQYTGYKDLSQQPKVLELLDELIQEANEGLDEPEQIKRFASLTKEFDPDDGELNRVGKLRRPIIRDRYEEVISAMYDDKDEVHHQTTITYQDGTESIEEGDIRIVTVGEEA